MTQHILSARARHSDINGGASSEDHVTTSAQRPFTAERCLGEPSTPSPAEKASVSSDDEAGPSIHMLLNLNRRKRRRTMANAPSTARPYLGSHDSMSTHSASMSHRQPYSPVAAHGFFQSTSALSSEDEDEIAHRTMMRQRRSIAVPESDRVARQRCFDYLLMAIDAVWAEYCISTSFAESQLYQQAATFAPCSPSSENDDLNNPMSPSSPSDTLHQPASMQPQCRRLLRLKKRLLDTKYYLSDIVGNNDPDSSSRFWKSWDVLKYEIVEQVEGDDDETSDVLDGLEDGRYY